MTLNDCYKLFGSAILAGAAIAIGGFVNLALGGVAGAVFFAFGLLTVVHYKWKLYTGYVGFLSSWSEFGQSFIVLAGNVVGCLFVGWLAKCSPLDLQAAADRIITGRLNIGPWRAGALAIGCGFIVTAAVTFGRQEKWWPLLFGVPTFILCGFPPCIADAFYYLAVPFSRVTLDVVWVWLACVAGNFIGCNFYRIILPECKK